MRTSSKPHPSICAKAHLFRWAIIVYQKARPALSGRHTLTRETLQHDIARPAEHQCSDADVIYPVECRPAAVHVLDRHVCERDGSAAPACTESKRMQRAQIGGKGGGKAGNNSRLELIHRALSMSAPDSTYSHARCASLTASANNGPHS